MAGWRYAYFGHAQHFPLSSLRVKWSAAQSKRGAYRAEGKLLLLSYLKRYCELPPLNYKSNWSTLD